MGVTSVKGRNMPQRIPRRGSVYYIRRVIPMDLREAMGCIEKCKSLKTKDYKEAQRLYRLADVKFDLQFERMRLALKNAAPSTPAATVRTDAISQADLDRQVLHDLEGSEFFAALYASEDENGLPYDSWLAERERIEALEIAAALAEHRRNASVSLLGLFDQYASEIGVRVATARQWRGHILHLVDFLGHDNALAIKPAILRKWRDHLAKELMPNGQARKAKTINGSYLAAVKVLLSWAVDRDIIQDDPSAGLKPLRREKETVLRDRNLTLAEQQTILKATLQEPSARLGYYKASARRWVPWLCAYTGARVSEITQARKQDVAEIEGVWTLRITPEAGDIKTNKARLVPLHPHLIEQGFLAFVAQSNGPLFYQPRGNLRPEARPPYKIVANRLADWVREIGVTEVPQPNHSWRHTFKSLSRTVGMEEAAADYIQGHAPANDSRAYGSHSIGLLAEQIAKLPAFQTE
ncbi:MAG: hypothetical protein APF82_00365 [Sphingomonadales bacterium BRH_c42]|nr:MAG: hypothetical protein APF82_00365 [Sphingomonadales bacterium BRH_c42]